jgi:hypothetical protein
LLVEPGEKALDATPLLEREKRSPELLGVGQVERTVPGVGGDGGDHLGPLHAEHQRTVAAGGLADDAACFPFGDGAEALIDEGEHLFHEIALIAADRGRVDVLGTTVTGKAVRQNDDRFCTPVRSEQGVQPPVERGNPGSAVQQLKSGARVTRKEQDQRKTSARRGVVRRRKIDTDLAVT